MTNPMIQPDTITRKRHYPGCYRVVSGASAVMGQIKKVGREWQAEIRDKLSGELLHYAGNWATLSDATNECERYVRRVCII